MHPFTTILFDLDGTLLDTREFILQAFEHTLKTHGSPKTRKDVLEIIGPPLYETYPKLLEHIDISLLVNTHIEFQTQNFHLVEPYVNTVITLQKLKEMGIKMAIVTSRSNRTAHTTLKNANIADYFETVITLEDVTHHKPHPEIIFTALKLLNETPDHAVMVGDTFADIEAGKNAGVMTVGVTTGFEGDSIATHHPDYVISDLLELPPLLSR